MTITNLLGDYNHDFQIDGDDLLVFSNAWDQQDASKEIGPATGAPPELALKPDRAVDFEDLSVFALFADHDILSTLNLNCVA